MEPSSILHHKNLASSLVHISSNLNGFGLLSSSPSVKRTIGIWSEEFKGKCFSSALGKISVHLVLTRALSSLSFMLARPGRLLD